MFNTLFDFEPPAARPVVWQPRMLLNEQWDTRDYRGVYQWRIKQLARLRSDPQFAASARVYYRTRQAEFIMHWMDTFDPRPHEGIPKWMPFVFFKRQAEFIDFLNELVRDQESGLVEKCRDVGATWLACAWSVHAWLFDPGASIGWGSRKEQLVDKLGDIDSIFEKMRKMIERLPDVFLPEGFNPSKHATFMRIINPATGATITGEAGDNIGRGGRKTVYFKDESAHYERPELIEAALGDNTNVQIDISSVNGLGNAFHRRREAGIDWVPGHRKIAKGKTRVFVFDWRDHPAKTQEWYQLRKAKAVAEGLEHVFAQEVDRDYAGAVTGTIIERAWVQAAYDAHRVLAHWGVAWDDGGWMGGLDVADDGGDTNAQANRKGVVLKYLEEWGSRDPGVTARRSIALCLEHPGMTCMYDEIGIGSNVKSEFNRLSRDPDPLTGKPVLAPGSVNFVGWNAGAGVNDPFYHIIEDDDESALNKDFFGNLKAQAWWSLRTRLYKTWQCVTTYLASKDDPSIVPVRYPVDQLISFDTKTVPLTTLTKLEKELAQVVAVRNSRLQTIIDKKPDGMKSPNLADGTVMCYFPVEDDNQAVFGTYATG